MLFVGLAGFGVGCNLVKLPGPAEVEKVFVGHGANIISVDPSEAVALPVHTEEIFTGDHVCSRCHPEPGTDEDGAFETGHIATFHGNRAGADCPSSNFPTEEQVREAVGGGIGLNFSHEHHLKLHRAECGQCHEISVHRHGVVASMATCLNCHKQLGGPTECSVCHPHWDEIMPYFHRDVDILKTHGKFAKYKEYCTRCHVQTGFCQDCHGIEMPHPDGYIELHNREVKGHPETCTGCHGTAPCLSCHTERGVFGSAAE